MMLTEEKVQLFYDSISCCYPMYHWEYDAALNLISANAPENTKDFDLMHFLNVSSVLAEAAEEEQPKPLIIETMFGLLFLAAFGNKGQEGPWVHVFGPAFYSSISKTMIRQQLHTLRLSPSVIDASLSKVENVPLVPNMVLSQYAIMLHFILTGERLTNLDVLQVTAETFSSKKSSDSEPQPSRDQRGGLYLREQEFLQLIRDGNPNYRKALFRMSNSSTGVKSDIKDPLRLSKNNTLILLTLISRAAVEGGLSASASFTLMDYYAGRIEQSPSLASVSQLVSVMIEDYVSRVRDQKTNAAISSEVRECQDYIRMNIEQPLTLEMLAQRSGYAPYYFSQKFKKETGLLLTDYITKAKMERAALLLKDSALSIPEILDVLSLQSRSHFYEAFKKWIGMNPSAYRKSS